MRVLLVNLIRSCFCMGNVCAEGNVSPVSLLLWGLTGVYLLSQCKIRLS